MISAPPAHMTRDLELEALQHAARWPHTAPSTILVLAGRFLARGRDQDAYVYFRERAEAEPALPLFRALEGQFQVRLASQVSSFERSAWFDEALGKLDRAVDLAPGLPTYIRGVVLTELPANLGMAEAARADLEWVIANPERVPHSFRRGAYRALVRARWDEANTRACVLARSTPSAA